MPFNKDVHHRRSVRLKEYDYSSHGAYFVTICTRERECLFGDIVSGQMILNKAGQIVKKCWTAIPAHFSHVELDEVVIMPNHLHGIIVICNDNCRGEVPSPIANTIISQIKQGGDTPPLQRHTLGKIVAYFKYQSTKHINQVRDMPGHQVWQRNYFEHVIRNDDELNRIREYTLNNTLRWAEDEENPANIEKGHFSNRPSNR